ncbi:recombinase family protein [Sulfitobacter sp. JBTF-M27]|uniref:Recombinase family protein n=2 Tax=Sulfitobacter sediminilitoris TaxID=2698830 RepID=A0A6P0CFF2_9RHOB|nr:recombinase family protein [Sulfitobacter sediminilitoris]NEK23203.1 recombinase family protein [Sulfitobacter sediminilitoris]
MALREAMDYASDGDTLVVTKLDRLARSVQHLGEIVDELEGKNGGLRSLDLGLDTSNSTGRLMLTVLGSVAQFEREMMLERQREGAAKAKAPGRYKRRKPAAQLHAEQIVALFAEATSRREVADQLALSERSVYRALKRRKADA